MLRIPKPRIRNFYVQDGVAYTEDRTIVRRVIIASLFSFSIESLEKYLSRFGTTEEIRWDVNKREGSVLFKEPTEAAKALYCAKHTLNGKSFLLRASRSWEQPEEEEELGRQSAYDLPIVDDIWCKVLDYLPLDSRLNFAASCRRFQSIYELESQRLNHVLKMKDVCQLTDWNIRRMMRLSGKHIRRLEGGPLHPRWSLLKQFVQLLGVSCPNLAELSLHRIPLNPDHMSYLFQNTSGLENIINLSLRRCEITDRHLLCLGSLTNLRTLDLEENPGLLGDTLGALPHSLQVLKLSGCENLEPTRLSNLSALPLLRELRCSEIHMRNFNRDWMNEDEIHMRNFNRDWMNEDEVAEVAADEHVYRELVKSCPMLEVLEMSVCPYMDERQLSGLPHLRTLILRAVDLEPQPYQVDNSMLMALVEVDSLRHLEFREAGPGFVDAFGLNIISKLKELRTLILRNQNFKADELRELRKLNALEFLDLSDSPHLSNEIIAELAKTLGKLRRLKIKRCPLISRRLTEILKENRLVEVDV